MYVNDTCVLGFTHHDMVTMFQSIATGDVVPLEVCRGYPLPFDPDDPNTEIVTTVAVTSPEQDEWATELERQRNQFPPGQQPPDVQSMPDLSAGGQQGLNHSTSAAYRPGSADLLGGGPSHHNFDFGQAENSSDFSSEVKNALSGIMNNNNTNDVMTIPITKGGMGFGFTIADSGFGQKVKKILDRPRCKNLQEGDVLTEINTVNVRNMSHSEVVQVLKDCSRGQEANISIQRGLLPASATPSSPTKNKYKNKDKFNSDGGLKPKSGILFRSKTPTADHYSTQEKEQLPNRPKTPLVDTRNLTGMHRSKTPTSLASNNPFQRNDVSRASLGVGSTGGGYGGPQSNYNAALYGGLNDQMSGMNLQDYNRSQSPGRDLDGGATGGYYSQGYPQQPQEYPGGYQPDPMFGGSSTGGYPEYNNVNYSSQQQMPSPGKMYGGGGAGSYSNYNGYPPQQQQGGKAGFDPNGGYGYTTRSGYSPGDGNNYRAESLPRNNGGRKESTSFEHSEPLPGGLTRWPRPERRPVPSECIELTVTLHRQDSGFGFRIVGGTEEGSQVG